MTPLVLVTGFLGAGKTTFLRHLLPALAARGLRARVVLNDYGDARVDAATLADIAPDLVALSGSCVCCESLEDMLAALTGITTRPGDVVIVEANGGTEAGELVALLGSEAGLDHLTQPLQLTVVDCKRFGTRGWQNEMEREQLETASHVAFGRRDLVDPARVDEVRAAVAAVAPRAVVVDAPALADELAALEPAVRALPGRTATGPAAPRDGHDHDHDLAPHFASLLLEVPGPVDADAFVRFLAGLPAEVVRAKGIVELRDPPGAKRTFQKVGDEAEVSPCELAEPASQRARAIFIGPHLPTAEIERRLRDVIAASATAQAVASRRPAGYAGEGP